MATELQPFKDFFSPQSVGRLSDYIVKVYPDFKKKDFEKSVFDKQWKDKELKERMRHITIMLHDFLPADFRKASRVLMDCVLQMRKEGIESLGIEYLSLPDYVEVYGLDDFASSVKAMELITQFISCEFAVRPFIIKYDDKMLQQMIAWGSHPNHKVRRLASEGCRPRLPWAMALPAPARKAER
jgi:3-methyladenine DNA glycosylase AlkC